MRNNIWIPKFKIDSDNHFFIEQILKVVEDYDIAVDLIEEKKHIKEEEPLIIIADHADIIESMGENLNNGKLSIYLILVLSDKSFKVNHQRITVFYQDDLRESTLASAIENLSLDLISKIKYDNIIATASKKLSEANELIDEYKNSLENSRLIQRSIMIPPVNYDDFETYTVYEPYRIVSGDVLFVKQVFDKMFIMIADVTDHGFLAGMYGAVLYALANNYIQRSSIIEQDVSIWGQYMMKSAKMFYPEFSKENNIAKNLLSASATFAVIDMSKCRIEICFYGSGTEPPILIKGDSVSAVNVSEDINIGVPLGEGNIMANPYRKKFFPGDMAVFYTDGATEIFSNLDNEQKDVSKIYSSKKVLKSIEEAVAKGKTSPDDIVSFVLRDANAYSLSTDITKNRDIPNVTDDLTIFCIKWRANR